MLVGTSGGTHWSQALRLFNLPVPNPRPPRHWDTRPSAHRSHFCPLASGMQPPENDENHRTKMAGNTKNAADRNLSKWPKIIKMQRTKTPWLNYCWGVGGTTEIRGRFLGEEGG